DILLAQAATSQEFFTLQLMLLWLLECNIAGKPVTDIYLVNGEGEDSIDGFFMLSPETLGDGDRG
ncbi:hypothetical protein ACJX0J_010855, partial [Zea mays]